MYIMQLNANLTRLVDHLSHEAWRLQYCSKAISLRMHCLRHKRIQQWSFTVQSKLLKNLLPVFSEVRINNQLKRTLSNIVVSKKLTFSFLNYLLIDVRLTQPTTLDASKLTEISACFVDVVTAGIQLTISRLDDFNCTFYIVRLNVAFNSWIKGRSSQILSVLI